MANHTKTITLTDEEQKLLSHDLYNDTSIPSNRTDFVNLVTARSDYKNRKARDDA